MHMRKPSTSPGGRSYRRTVMIGSVGQRKVAF